MLKNIKLTAKSRLPIVSEINLELFCRKEGNKRPGFMQRAVVDAQCI